MRSWMTCSRAACRTALAALVAVAVLAPGLAGAAVDRVVTPEEQAWLDQVNAEIERNGYDWVAGPTSVSGLTPEQKARLLGGEIPPEVQAIYDTLRPEPEALRASFRSSFDWRALGGVTPAKDQADCGSCWAFGATGATEAHAKIYEGVTLDLSEQQALDCNTYGSSCDGGWAGAAYEVHMSPGAVSEECLPYRAQDGLTCRQGLCEPQAIIDGSANVANTVAALKYACQTYGPIAVGMCVYDDFYGYQNGCYEHTGTSSTNHVVLLVGWDDAMCSGAGAWICKNSWGRDFGEDGFFYIKYGTCRIGEGALRPVNTHVPKTLLVPTQYATIPAAMTASKRGDTIKVAGGTYNGPITVSDYRILLGGYSPDFSERDPDAYPTIVDGGGTGNVFSCQAVNRVVIDGFKITNSSGSTAGVNIANAQVTVRDCEIYGCWRGVSVVYASGATTSGQAVVEYCDIHDNSAAGVYIYDPNNPRVRVEWNAIYQNGTYGVYAYSEPTDIINNTIALNGSNGINVATAGSDPVKNNIVASNTGYGINCASATPVITYNDVWSNTAGDYNGCTGGAGSISQDPIFCDGPGGDVSVHATSPTLDAGEFGADMGALGIGCPAGPQNLVVAQNGASLELVWERPEPGFVPDYYVVYRDTTALPNYVLGTVAAPDTTFTDVTIPPCREHMYRVSAVDASLLETASSNIEPGEICYAGPVNLRVTFVEGANELAWSPGEGPIDYYAIMRGNELAAPDSIDLVSSADTTYVDLTEGECPRDNYEYEILPVYDTGWHGSRSPLQDIDPTPSPPSGVTVQWSGSDAVLTWSPNCESDFRRYWVYRDTAPISPPVNDELLITFTPDTTYVDPGLDPGGTYFYRLTATDASSKRSDYSAMVWLGEGETISVPSQYATIQAAINASAALDTVLVSPGTYSEHITLKDGVFVVSSGGAAATTISSSSGTIVTASGLGDLALLKGFTVDGLGTATYGLDAWGSYLRVEDCTFKRATYGASFRYGGACGVSGNVFTLNQNGVACGDSSMPVLTGNEFNGNPFTGLYNSGAPGPLLGGSLADANDFVNRGAFHVFNLVATPVAAEYNYWGDACVESSWFYGAVDYVPWTDEVHSGVYTECSNDVPDGGRAYASHNYPNPFNPVTAISYTVPGAGAQVRLAIYDLTGRKVRTLVDEGKAGGDHVVTWRGEDEAGRAVGSGVYFYRLEIGDYRVERKMVMLK